VVGAAGLQGVEAVLGAFGDGGVHLGGGEVAGQEVDDAAAAEDDEV